MNDQSFATEYQHRKKRIIDDSIHGVELAQAEKNFITWFIKNEDLDSVSKLASIITKARLNHCNQS